MFRRVPFAAFVNKDRCVGCRTCERNCPVRAIRVLNGKARVSYWMIPMCLGCGICSYVCPQQAIYPVPRISIPPAYAGFVIYRQLFGFRVQD